MRRAVNSFYGYFSQAASQGRNLAAVLKGGVAIHALNQDKEAAVQIYLAGGWVRASEAAMGRAGCALGGCEAMGRRFLHKNLPTRLCFTKRNQTP